MKKSTAKLLHTAVCLIMTIACFTASCFQVSAVAPPYSKGFNNQEDMLASLKIYCEQFPNVEDYSPYGSLAEEHNGYHLESKNIITPKIDDTNYNLIDCSYADISYGSGVNYTFYNFCNTDTNEKNYKVFIYYYLTEEAAKKRLTTNTPTNVSGVYEGNTDDGISYFAYSYKDENGNDKCRYNLVIGDIFVNIQDCKGYQEDTVNLFSFKVQDVKLPVFVMNNDVSFEYIINDVNADGEFNITDVTYLQKVLANLCKYPEKYNDIYVEDIIDTNGDGNINIQDATAMQKLLAEYD